jgi:hypothetical protein
MPMTDPSWINAKRKESDPYKCEEASLFIPSTAAMYVPCGALATHKMWSEQDGRHYWMCDMCADHNTRRGMKEIAA